MGMCEREKEREKECVCVCALARAKTIFLRKSQPRDCTSIFSLADIQGEITARCFPREMVVATSFMDLAFTRVT